MLPQLQFWHPATSTAWAGRSVILNRLLPVPSAGCGPPRKRRTTSVFYSIGWLLPSSQSRIDRSPWYRARGLPGNFTYIVFRDNAGVFVAFQIIESCCARVVHRDPVHIVAGRIRLQLLIGFHGFRDPASRSAFPFFVHGLFEFYGYAMQLFQQVVGDAENPWASCCKG